MANSITYEARPDLPFLQMNNSLTSVFIGVLALAASSLAATRRHCQLASWIAARDQGVYGLGTVGFDVSEMPWEIENFVEDRSFLLRAIATAKAKDGWRGLGYEPKEEWLTPCLDKFQVLLAAFAPADIRAGATNREGLWSAPQFERCRAHGLIRHAHGCPICNGA
ncbi:hypothetical protein J8I29_27970 [Labrys sp. LIt4]|uniref:Uncharacterized protein n=1 Tax=Labrys okinawensis TaxID=346911 RepID=A0A2S9QFB8_9HYPH|nr:MULTISPECIES: hypothetical protein [Labrys]MBP0583196.1 hypothetical protein [Labrys sp. LIt4]PRH88043.1 hypothetical protein C5L14_09130 [Labrys okinawensis]